MYLSPRERERFQIKVPLLDGPSYIYNARERESEIKVAWRFLIQSYFLPTSTRERREKRKSARDFCDDEENLRLAAWIALMVVTS